MEFIFQARLLIMTCHGFPLGLISKNDAFCVPKCPSENSIASGTREVTTAREKVALATSQFD